jgi:hypothetical protein
MLVRVPLLVAGAIAASSLLSLMQRNAPVPADQCIRYVGTPMDTVEVLLRRVR